MMRHVASVTLSVMCLSCASRQVSREGPVARDPAVPDAAAEAAVLAAYERAAQHDPEAEWQLVLALEKRGLPVAATNLAIPLVRDPSHPHTLDAVVALLRLMELTGDDYLVPNTLNAAYDSERWSKLPADKLASLNLLIADLDNRNGRLDEALMFLAVVPRSAPVDGKARVLTGTIKADARLPEPLRRLDEAEAALGERIAGYEGLASLALGRVRFGRGRFAEAVDAYDEAAKYEAQRSEALFEGAYARFLAKDLKGARATLTKAQLGPELAEAVLLRAIIEHTDGKWDASDDALGGVGAITALADDISRAWDTEQEASSDPFAKMSPLARRLVMSRRIERVRHVQHQAEAERAAIAAVAGWPKPFAEGLGADVAASGKNAAVVADRLTKNRSLALYHSLRDVAAQAEGIRFENALARARAAAPKPGRYDSAIALLRDRVPRGEMDSDESCEHQLYLAALLREAADDLLATDPGGAKERLREALSAVAPRSRADARCVRRDEILFMTGAIHEQLGDLTRAAKAYQQLITELPSSPRAVEVNARAPKK